MKIVNNNIGIRRYGTLDIETKEITNKIPTGRNFDEIKISADNAEMDKIFATRCVKKIKEDIRKPVSEELIEDLRQKIKNNEYKIDYDKLVQKIMLEA